MPPLPDPLPLVAPTVPPPQAPVVEMVNYLGIDPGRKGAVAVIQVCRTGGKVKEYVRAFRMPEAASELWAVLIDFIPGPGVKTYAVVEQVGGYVGNRGKRGEEFNQPGSSMFRFGRNYGAILMGLTAAAIPHATVAPQRWQRAIGAPTRAKASSQKERRRAGQQHKNDLKQLAAQIFLQETHGVRVTLNNCDALLLAEYCRRAENP